MWATGRLPAKSANPKGSPPDFRDSCARPRASRLAQPCLSSLLCQEPADGHLRFHTYPPPSTQTVTMPVQTAATETRTSCSSPLPASGRFVCAWVCCPAAAHRRLPSPDVLDPTARVQPARFQEGGHRRVGPCSRLGVGRSERHYQGSSASCSLAHRFRSREAFTTLVGWLVIRSCMLTARQLSNPPATSGRRGAGTSAIL